MKEEKKQELLNAPIKKPEFELKPSEEVRLEKDPQKPSQKQIDLSKLDMEGMDDLMFDDLGTYFVISNAFLIFILNRRASKTARKANRFKQT